MATQETRSGKVAQLRFTVTTKILLIVGSSILLCVLAVIGLYTALRTIEAALDQVIHVAEPITAASYEMEINVLGTGLGIMKYLETGLPQHRQRVQKDTTDFAHFKAQYDRLATTVPARHLGARVATLYAEFTALGESLMQARDRQEAHLHTILTHFEAMNAIVDNHLRMDPEQDNPPPHVKLITVLEIDQEIATISAWLGHFLRTTDRVYRAYVEAHSTALQANLVWFATLPLTPAEAYWSDQLYHYLAQTTPLLHEVIALHETRHAHLEQFVHLRTTLDDLLDEGIQTLSRQDLMVAEADAERLVDNVHLWLGLLLLLGLLRALGILLASRYWFLQPLARLITGVESIGRGDLAHRVSVPSHDELGRLAMTFNQMAANLQQDREALRQAHQVLEQRVQERTAALSDTVAQLQHSRAEVRALAARLLSLQEEERKHIAREMHDELGQTLTALLLDLAWAGQRLLPGQAALQHKLDSMTGLVDRALDTLGDMVTALRPRVLDDLGLSAAVEWQVWEFQKRTEIACTLAMEPESLPLDAARATTVFRVLQEALTNVARHADATTVWVTLRLTAQALCLTVQDNGRGISAQALSDPHAFGILGMHERVLTWGGECRIVSPQSGGTVVTICLPLRHTVTPFPEETAYAEGAHR